MKKKVGNYTLYSSNNNQDLSLDLIPPLLLPGKRRVYLSLLGISCPPPKRKRFQGGGGGLIKVYGSINGEKERLLLLKADGKDYRHEWSKNKVRLEINSLILNKINLRVEPERQLDSQTSTAAVKIFSMPEAACGKEYFFSNAPNGFARRFKVLSPPELRDERRCFSVALYSVTYNPHFRIFPFVSGDAEPTYEFSWKTGRTTHHKTFTYRELFDGARNKSEIHSLARSLMSNVFEKENLCLVEEDEKLIRVTWLVKAEIILPEPVARLLSWKAPWENENKKNTFLQNAIRSVEKNGEMTFSPSSKNLKTWLPRNLQIETNFMSGEENSGIFKTIPVKDYVSDDEEYRTYDCPSHEFYTFRYPGQEYLTFDIKTPAGSYAAFENETSSIYLTCIFREFNKKC